MLNQVNIMGRLTANPEIKITPNNKSVCSFTIANSQGYKDNERTHFIDCVAWNTTAEFLNKYFCKGSLVVITGVITARNYTDKNKNNRKITEILVSEINFSGEKSRNNTDNHYEEHVEEPGTIEPGITDIIDTTIE